MRFKNLYISAGIGFVINHITQINRYSIQLPGYFTDGENSSQEPFIPMRIGYEFKLFNKYQQPSTKIDIGYQYNLVLGDGLAAFQPAHTRIYTRNLPSV